MDVAAAVIVVVAHIFRPFVSNPENTYPLCCYKIFKHLSSRTVLGEQHLSILCDAVSIYAWFVRLFGVLLDSICVCGYAWRLCTVCVWMFCFLYVYFSSLLSLIFRLYFTFCHLFTKCVCVFAEVSNCARVAAITLPIAICDSESCFIYIFIHYI